MIGFAVLPQGAHDLVEEEESYKGMKRI